VQLQPGSKPEDNHAPTPKPDTTAMETASLIPTKTESATSLKSKDVPMMQPATTTPMQPTTTVRASTLKPDTTAMVNCIVDTDQDGICDAFEVAGCSDDAACNYNADATDDDGSCTYAENGYDCDGQCLADTDGDGICDAFEVAGCTDPLRPTTTHLQPTTMLRASTPFASIPKHVTTPSSVETITASLYSHTKSMMEWWAIKTSDRICHLPHLHQDAKQR